MESINTIQKYPAKAMRQHNKLSNLIVKKMSQLNTTSSVLKRNLNAIFGLMSLTTVICLTLTLEVQAQDMAYSGQDPVVQSGNENGPVGSPIAAGYLVRTKDGMRGVPVTENSTMAPPPLPPQLNCNFTASVSPASTSICPGASTSLTANTTGSGGSNVFYTRPSFTTAYGAAGSNLDFSWNASTDELSFSVTLGPPTLTSTNPYGAYLYVVVSPGNDPSTYPGMIRMEIKNGYVEVSRYTGIAPLCTTTFPASIVSGGGSTTYSFTADLSSVLACTGYSGELMGSQIGYWVFASDYSPGGPYTVSDEYPRSTTSSCTGGFTYAWSNGMTTKTISVSPATTTIYTVTVTDCDNCSTTTSATVTVNPTPNAAMTVTESSGVANNDGTTCSGATVTLSASGGTSYTWSNTAITSATSVVPTTSTTYTVTVRNASGCTATVTRDITVNPIPTASVNNVSFCAGGSGTITATTSAVGASYAWTVPSGVTNPGIPPPLL